MKRRVLIGATMAAGVAAGLPLPAARAETKEKIARAVAKVDDGSVVNTPMAKRSGREAVVYFTRDLSAEGLRKIVAKVSSVLTGKVAVKLHTGEKQLHAGATGQQWGITGREFMENMVDATKGITDYFKGHVCYVNVLRRMSVDCDCAGKAAEEPRVPDIGIFASLDLLAIEQASVDAVYDLGKAGAPLQERIESRHGLRQLSALREIGLGTEKYRIVDLDKA